MVEADSAMRAGRNGFLVLFVALLFVWAYQFVFLDETDQTLFALWALGAAVFYVSKYYYDRTDESEKQDDITEGETERNDTGRRNDR